MTHHTTTRGSVWTWIERTGNALPDPITLFMLGCICVFLGSDLASRWDWTVTHPQSGEVERARSLATRDGIWWIWQSAIHNFTQFPPLGVVLVGMLGIGVLEHSGLMGALLSRLIALTPPGLITPMTVFAGVMSSLGTDAGYIVLPPLACAVYQRVGRSPLVGLAAVFAGIGAGFSANLVITGLDPLLQSFTQTSAQILLPDYVVDVRCNYYFMFVSTFLITAVGWVTTEWIVEPRFSADDVQRHAAEFLRGTNGSSTPSSQTHESSAVVRADKSPNRLASQTDRTRESLAIVCAGFSLLLVLTVIGRSVAGAHGVLHGQVELRPGVAMDRWVTVIVPLLAVSTALPGLVYGWVVGSIRSDRDLARMFNSTFSALGPYIVMAFFAAQFVAWFNESNLGRLMALRGVLWLRQWELPATLLVIAIIGLTALLNLFIGSASAKWALISTVFVPLFAGVGISPELTQAAYRVGDSVTNVIAPLNPYVVIVLVFLQRCDRRAGLGSMISLMLPYAITFGISWTVLLIGWVSCGWPLGPGGRLLLTDVLP